MALTLDELQRLAPHLDPAFPVARAPQGVSGCYGAPAQRWRLNLANPRERRIALLAFPIADVTLTLEGFSPATEEQFLARFHLVYRKGGG